MNAKKDLKEMINENGFFLQISEIEQVDANEIKTKSKLPKGENILFFKGLASESFAKGEVSRNQYKIDVNGWNFDNYRKNAQLLLSHNPEEPIGKTISMEKTESGLSVSYFVNLDWMSEVDAERMAKEFARDVS